MSKSPLVRPPGGATPVPSRPTYLPLLLIFLSSTSNVSPAGSPAPPAKKNIDLHSSTRAKSDAHALDESETDDGITDEEWSDNEIEYISLPKLKPEIFRADLTSDQVFLCCMPRPAMPVDQMYNMQENSDNSRLDPVQRKLPIRIHKWAGLYDQKERSSETCLRINLEETTKCTPILKTILCGYTRTKWTRANWMSFDDNWTSCTDLAEFDHLQVHMERVACW